jgi:hypothetical protein
LFFVAVLACVRGGIAADEPADFGGGGTTAEPTDPSDPPGTTATPCDGPAQLASGAVFDRIQAALDAAASGEEVIVCPGQWNEDLVLDAPVILRSRDGRDTTTLASPMYGRVLTITAVGAEVRGFRLAGGNTVNPGGAVSVAAGGSAVLDDCLIDGARQYYGDGGAVWIGESGSSRSRTALSLGTSPTTAAVACSCRRVPSWS